MAATPTPTPDDTDEDAGQPQPEEGALARGGKGWSKTHEAGYQAAMREVAAQKPAATSAPAPTSAAARPVTLPKPAPTFGGQPSATGGAGALPRQPVGLGGAFTGPPAPGSANNYPVLPNTPEQRFTPVGTGPLTGATKTTNPDGTITTNLPSGGTATANRPTYGGAAGGLPRAPQPVGPTPPVGGTQAMITPPTRKQVAVQPRGGLVQPNDSY